MRRAVHEVRLIPVYGGARRKKATWNAGLVIGGFMTRKYVHRAIAVLVAGLGISLVLRVYISRELLAALFLFSLVFAAVAVFCFAFVLLDWFSQVLVLKMQGTVRAPAALSQPLLIFRQYVGRKYSVAVHHPWGH